MNRLNDLKKANTKKGVADILGVPATFLKKVLYKNDISTQYHQFKIPKRTGGYRLINAPSDQLKELQSNLSELLLDCIDEINNSKDITSTLSHGFVRRKSIVTNALMHINRNSVLNIDLKDFFNCFNYGRVRGFFIKNKNFLLNEEVANVISMISILDNTLPQGSPSSPVITNLITHSLDIRLSSLAKKHSCIYP